MNTSLSINPRLLDRKEVKALELKEQMTLGSGQRIASVKHWADSGVVVATFTNGKSNSFNRQDSVVIFD